MTRLSRSARPLAAALPLALPPALALALAACASAPGAPALPPTQERFWEALASHCGKTYEGALASADARDAAFQGKAMLAHWAECSPARIAIAFHVADEQQAGGWDRSRTWLVTRTADGLRLKHDHRHDPRHGEGGADAVTRYGGDTLSPGTARIQDFPVDAYSIALFGREGLAVSTTNVWRMEVDPASTAEGPGGARFAYQLTRRDDPTRLFRVEFDASDPVAPPPAAWGW